MGAIRLSRDDREGKFAAHDAPCAGWRQEKAAPEKAAAQRCACPDRGEPGSGLDKRGGAMAYCRPR